MTIIIQILFMLVAFIGAIAITSDDQHAKSRFPYAAIISVVSVAALTMTILL